ncbi:energy transducer TonB [Pseudomonas sp. PDM27]|uniref:energy transducer TonB n=1 Tax=Pseudomonas sp. PDM27 TaxID=2854769 RepID=UPI001C439135|nr:energy transducer TonB [Pseudomonas sp. PDM27]MBV7570425.1 TonB family protein [Pseudomonas sp. PDM27]
MKHFWGCLGLSIALHLSAGWLVREIQAAPEPLAFQPPMAIQLVTLAPIAVPAPTPPQPVRPPAPMPASAPAPVPAPVPTKQPETAKAETAPTPVKPLPVSTQPSLVKAPGKPQPPAEPRGETRPEPRRADPVELPATMAQTPTRPAPAATPAAAPAQNAKPTLPVAAAPAPMLTPVVSLRPSFVTPPPAPRYPNTARRRNQQGVVRIEVRLDERGQQLKLTLVRSSGVESLDQAALEAVTTWRFRPEIVDGRAVPSRVEIPIEFALTANR